MKKHLAIFKGEAGELILSGKKTIESRFSQMKNPPFGVISSGDLVYIKPSGKDIIGEFRVKKVIFFDGLNADDINDLKSRYESDLAVEKDYWNMAARARFGTLIFIGDSSRFITSLVKIKKSDLRGWVALG